jgi:hypothetical protein
MLTCADAVKQMHDYLDGDLSDDKHPELKTHLDMCHRCSEHFKQLQKLLAVIGYESETEAKSESDLCQQIMRSLPKVRLLKRLLLWLRIHPIHSLASACGIVMFGAWMMTWDFEPKLLVKIPDQDSVVINGHHVLIPQHTIIHGDVFVGNGKIDISGHVEGDLVVMNGQYTLSPQASVKGSIHEIDYAYERWILQMENWMD